MSRDRVKHQPGPSFIELSTRKVHVAVRDGTLAPAFGRALRRRIAHSAQRRIDRVS